MSCQKCLIYPNYHSFVNFGVQGTTRLFYTSPARATDTNKDGTKLENFKKHLLDTKGEPWIWFLDCNGMTAKDYANINFCMDLLKTLSTQYSDTLKDIIFINPNIWVKTTVATCKKMSTSKIFDKVKMLEGSPLELFLMYEKLSIPQAPLKWLISIDAGKVLPPVTPF